MKTTIVWLRNDLRRYDNPALAAAAERGAVVPVWIDEPRSDWAPGAAAQVWLNDSLAALDADLRRHGSRLVLRRGDPAQVLVELLAECGADAVYWNRRYSPAGMARDSALKRALGERGEVRSFAAFLLDEPHRVRTAAGTPYKVFTPFYRACREAGPPPRPQGAPAELVAPATWPESLLLAGLGFEPRIDWTGAIRRRWDMGERAAQARLEAFVEGALRDYAEGRDCPAAAQVSGLSPYLCWGELSVRDAWWRVHEAMSAAGGGLDRAGEAWLRQLAWREFAWHLLYHFPHTSEAPLREDFAALPWRDDEAALRAWQRGETGFPLVDAGMRELWATGYMHNRVRMVTASLLTKHLGLHWLHGARWFWDTLVDADLANNTLGWQWVAGCGADAAPYFRIFNPLTQSRKFDPEGAYIKRWVPELRALDGRRVHEPGDGVAGYPAPIVELAAARRAALERYAAIRS